MRHKYFDKEKLIREYLALEKPPEIFSEQIKRLINTNMWLNIYFFSNIPQQGWLDAVMKAGLITPNKEALQRNEKGNYASWPAGIYLRKLESLTLLQSEMLLKQVMQIDTDNPLIIDELVLLSMKLPRQNGDPLIQKIIDHLNRAEHLYHHSIDSICQLILTLSKRRKRSLAFKLIDSIFSLSAPRKVDGESQLFIEPISRCEQYDFERALKGINPNLSKSHPAEWLEYICLLLNKYYHISKSESGRPPEDYSYYAYPKIEEINRAHGVEDSLIREIVKSTRLIIDGNSLPIIEVLRILEKCDWDIFYRITLYLIKEYSSDSQLVYRALKKYINSYGLLREWSQLANSKMNLLEAKQKATLVDSIFIGPQNKEENGEGYLELWQRERLNPIQEYLSVTQTQQFRRIVKKVGKSDRTEDFTREQPGLQAGPNSPISAADLANQSVSTVLENLNKWSYDGVRFSASPEGYGRQLAADVANRPDEYSENALRFKDFVERKTYIRSLFNGMRDAIREKNKAFNWDPVLDLAIWVVDQPESIEVDESDWADHDGLWRNTRKSIADMLEDGFSSKENPFKTNQKDKLLHIIQMLANDSDPSLSAEEDIKSSGHDPFTASINCVRGEAIHALVKFYLWLYRYKSDPEYSFEQEPIALKILENHLDIKKDSSLAIRAVYGHWIPWLLMMDEKWTKTNIEKIFPSDDNMYEYWKAAWGGYIRYDNPYDNVYAVLTDQYERAVDVYANRDDPKGVWRSELEGLTQHLMAYYWRGLLDLSDDGLLHRFFIVSSAEARESALTYIGWALRDTPGVIEPKFQKKLIELWDWRLDFLKSSNNSGLNTAEVSGFANWFSAGKIDHYKWLIDSLQVAIDIAPMISHQSQVIEQLEKFKTDYPNQVINVCSAIIKNRKESYLVTQVRESIKSILEYTSGDPRDDVRYQSNNLLNMLAEMGYADEYRDIWLENFSDSPNPSIDA